MNSGLVVFIVVMAAISGLILYLWVQRRGRMARGIGSAAAKYNEFYGQGRLPETPLPPEQNKPDTGH